jgi:hypothetical protein
MSKAEGDMGGVTGYLVGNRPYLSTSNGSTDLELTSLEPTGCSEGRSLNLVAALKRATFITVQPSGDPTGEYVPLHDTIIKSLIAAAA